MKKEILTRYVEAGLPHFRQASKLPECLAPDTVALACELGDQAMLEIAEPLGISEKIKAGLEQATKADELPIEKWQEVTGRWQAIDQVMPVMMALLRAREKVEALERRDVSIANSTTMARALATIACATFAPDGGKILDRLAGILGGNPNEPAALLIRYVETLESGDRDILDAVDECILRDPAWTEWFNRFSDRAATISFTPRVVGISPVSTAELIRLLAEMIREVTNADNRRDIRNRER